MNGQSVASASAGPRSPAIVYTALAVTMSVVVAAMALNARQPAPPSIAELAPQASEQIKDALAEQGSEFGGGPGGDAPSTSALLNPPPPPPPSLEELIDVPRVRRCVGNPPRQTEDPRSPSCVPYFAGDNGGTTSPGVTATEIRVAFPRLLFFEDEMLMAAMVNHFNSRYEFYGRKIGLKTYDPRDGFYATPNPPNMIADAIHVDETLDAFASLSYAARFGAEHHYYDELARRQIISIAHRASAISTESRYSQFAPYEWNTWPAIDAMLRNVGEFSCNVLNNRPPIYAGPPQNAPPERVFGLIYNEGTDGTVPPIQIFQNVASNCGITFSSTFKLRESLDEAQRAQNSQAAISAMQQAQPQVTSIICWCDVSMVRDGLMRVATAQVYFPEWVLSNYIDNDVDNSFRNAPADQATHVIGVSLRDKWLPNPDTAWWSAMKEGSPGYAPSADNQGYPMSGRYNSLLVLASGIQGAGPKLTPETFQDGLFKTKFPNVGAGGPPYYQARAGYEGGRHTLINDGTMWWYDRAQQGTVEPGDRGAVCYVRQGARYGLGQWPNEEPQFYQGPCR